MSERDRPSVHIGRVGGSIVNSNIAGRDVTVSPATGQDDPSLSIAQLQAALKEILPQIIAELGASSPAAPHLAAATSAALDDAAGSASKPLDAPAAKEVGSKLAQVETMLKMILDGAVKVPDAVEKAEEGGSNLLMRLTELAAKVGTLAVTIGHMFH